MSAITTHVLDTSLGRPAAGVSITLERLAGGQWASIGQGVTDADGRLKTLTSALAALTAGDYRLTFDTGAYFRGRGVDAFYPHVVVTFTIPASADGSAAAQHYHVPLLLNPFGYSTYRGS